MVDGIVKVIGVDSVVTFGVDIGYTAVGRYEECTVTVKDAEGSVLIDQADADVKVRGNWTTMYNKKPFRIKFADKQSMLGLNDELQKLNAEAKELEDSISKNIKGLFGK